MNPVRTFIGERDGWVCAYCGKAIERHGGHLEHVIPLTARERLYGPPDLVWRDENLVLACERCNLVKGARTPVQWFVDMRRDRRLGEVPYLAAFLVEMTERVGAPLWNPRCDNPPRTLDLSWFYRAYDEDVAWFDWVAELEAASPAIFDLAGDD